MLSKQALIIALKNLKNTFQGLKTTFHKLKTTFHKVIGLAKIHFTYVCIVK